MPSPWAQALTKDEARERRWTRVFPDPAYLAGFAAGRWARENVPCDLDRRGGYPMSESIVAHAPEWTHGYIEGAKVR